MRPGAPAPAAFGFVLVQMRWSAGALLLYPVVAAAVQRLAAVPSYAQLPPYEAARFDYDERAHDARRLGSLRPEFRAVKHGRFALQKLLDEYAFESVVDVGSGTGEHAELFTKHGKHYTGIEFGGPTMTERTARTRRARRRSAQRGNATTVKGDFNTMDLSSLHGAFDVVWVSQVLEHQLDAQAFLKRVVSLCKEGGLIVLGLPVIKTQVVGGHVSLWTAGLVFMHLVHAGVDCTDARVNSENAAFHVFVTKRTISETLPWEYVYGDVDRASPYLPYVNGKRLGERFHGEIAYLNW